MQAGRQTEARHAKEQLKQVAVIIDWNVLMWLQRCIVWWRLLSYGKHYNRLHIPLANSKRESTSPPPHLLSVQHFDAFPIFCYLWHICCCFCQTAQKRFLKALQTQGWKCDSQQRLGMLKLEFTSVCVATNDCLHFDYFSGTEVPCGAFRGAAVLNCVQQLLVPLVTVSGFCTLKS